MHAAPASARTVSTILIRPRSGAWECFECPGVQPRFRDRDAALGYARQRAGGRWIDLIIHDAAGAVESIETIRSATLTLYTGADRS